MVLYRLLCVPQIQTWLVLRLPCHLIQFQRLEVQSSFIDLLLLPLPLLLLLLLLPLPLLLLLLLLPLPVLLLLLLLLLPLLLLLLLLPLGEPPLPLLPILQSLLSITF